jgi:PAS domain-containing protein
MRSARSAHAHGPATTPVDRPAALVARLGVPGSIAAGLLGIAFASYRLRLARAQRVQRELRALADNAPDVVIRFDHELRIAT